MIDTDCSWWYTNRQNWYTVMCILIEFIILYGIILHVYHYKRRSFLTDPCLGIPGCPIILARSAVVTYMNLSCMKNGTEHELYMLKIKDDGNQCELIMTTSARRIESTKTSKLRCQMHIYECPVWMDKHYL